VAHETGDQAGLVREISASELWRSAALYGYRFPAPGRRVAELPDPFEPLFEIWRRGYALDSITQDAIVLVAPASSWLAIARRWFWAAF
jgi:hypothetical protein